MVNISNPIPKVKTAITGESGALKTPIRFLLSLGIGFGLGVMVDLFLEYLVWNHLQGVEFFTKRHFQGQLDLWKWLGLGVEGITGDDVIQLAIVILMLFTKRFVLTLGFTLGWITTSYYGIYQSISLPTGA